MKSVGEKISYNPKKRLGEGGFAFVYEGFFDGLKVAVKRPKGTSGRFPH